ncbi:MAG: Lrp/AsnC ligand binding domain-containing protein [Gammaproteobacteria bacterium]|nr:Lrp/AsnC ligand binding domain-containing protein [Gammaproteobacteria bacterium]
MNLNELKNSDLDLYDRKILHHLSTQGRMSISELSDKVGLSKTPCQIRYKRLIEQGYILGFQANLNHPKLGLDHVAFVEVKLTDTTEKALKAFNEEVAKVREIEQCHLIAGSFDYLLKVRTTDITNYRRVLGEHISSLPYVGNTSTYVSMEAIKE